VPDPDTQVWIHSGEYTAVNIQWLIHSDRYRVADPNTQQCHGGGRNTAADIKTLIYSIRHTHLQIQIQAADPQWPIQIHSGRHAATDTQR
jgi:hypothetical protein